MSTRLWQAIVIAYPGTFFTRTVAIDIEAFTVITGCLGTGDDASWVVTLLFAEAAHEAPLAVGFFRLRW